MSPEAYEHYLQGRHQLRNRNVDQAAAEFTQVVALAPNYAEAYAALAASYALSAVYGDLMPREAAGKAKMAARRALELDDSLAEAHASLGLALCIYDWDWAVAENEFTRALALNPSDEHANLWYGDELSFLGRFDEALVQMQRARSRADITSNPSQSRHGFLCSSRI